MPWSELVPNQLMGLDMQILIFIDISRNMLNCISVTVPVRTFHFTSTTHFCASEVVLLTRTAHCVAGSFASALDLPIGQLLSITSLPYKS